MTFQIKLYRIIIIAAIFLYVIIPISASGISCFKCSASQSGNEKNDLLCSHFNGSAQFQVYCPSSTLCRKKTIYSKFQSSVITAVERDCAPQKRIIHIYNPVDNVWNNKEEIVETAYEEGCFIGEDRGAPVGPPEYCFCSFHLCNSSHSITTMNICQSFVLIVILLFTKQM
ncbi:uncharacterized protein LOC143185327 [Calliopsis andreniformis]|uniref:uncharacterized protein LOC143185327 n=1 Tax=Calliopsis andreniformis TaxID=337506 RepID=UPI003FCD1EF5